MAAPIDTPRGHKNARADLTAEYVRSILDYDPKTGIFRWRVRLNKRKDVGRIGDIAGCVKEKGRVKIGINGKEYMAHRLAWLVMTSEWPRHEIDHIDMDQANNRWHNLRDATSSQNQAHRPLRRNNSSGITGVCFETKRGVWLAYINKQIIGTFTNKSDAIACRIAAVDDIHNEYAHPDSYGRP